tara:strand:+ start:1418 stop:2416 length:999 start_codon:yes stop_codon:yes gene_type:complete
MRYSHHKKTVIGVILAVIFLIGLVCWITLSSELEMQPEVLGSVDSDEEDDGHETSENRSLKLSSKYIDEFNIKIETPRSVTLMTEIVLPGEITVNQDTMVHLYPRFPGIVKEINKNLGDFVHAGESIAVIESNNSLVEYVIKSPVSGIIISKDANVGENLNGVFPAFEIANFTTVWVEINIYQKDLPLVKVGQTIHVLAGHGLTPVEAKIDYINPIVSESTRTGLARAILPNDDRYWRPGMFITARVLVREDVIPLAIKKASIQKIGGKDSVFIKKSGEDLFEVRTVVLGRSDKQYVEVLENLRTEELYVAEGSFILKSEFEKESLSGGHGH